ncbi:MAG: alpha-amylase/4-alpha-glucanotransferase domain-containing protein [Myxococcota bacterium]
MASSTRTSAPTRLLLALHFHQPFGNLDHVFEDAMDRCYLRTLEALQQHPRVRAAIHVSGPLLDWAETHRPAFLDALRRLVTRGQVEVLGGGYQEPMLAILPDRDAIGQLVTMADRCEDLLGQRPQGMWLAERVWEPDLARIIATAGYGYTLLDDTHLRAAGISGALDAYYVTDKAGHSVAVFPIDYGLRTRIPFAEVDELMDYLGERAGRVAVYGDDAEKFGLWPTTERRVWDDAWLRTWLEAIEPPGSAVRTVLPSQILRDTPSGRAVYLPSISYLEMGAWALPAAGAQRFSVLAERLRLSGYADDVAAFLRGGTWPSFLAKYPEANLIYRKMLRVSDAVQRASERGDPKTNLARQWLYRGQCNCAYWHGLFGGLYLQHLRAALWEALLRAEALVDRPEEVRVERIDADGDREDEIVVSSPHYHVVVSPRRGGSALTLELTRAAVHLTGVMGRRQEAYHVDVTRARVVSDADLGNVSAHDLVRATEENLSARLVYDTYPRGAFVDHLLPAGAGPEELDDDSVPRPDLPHARFVVDRLVVPEADDPAPASALLRATVAGHQVAKSFVFRDAALEVHYEVAADATAPDPHDTASAWRFATQLDVTLLTPETVGGRRIDVVSAAPDAAPTTVIPGFDTWPDEAPGAARIHEGVGSVRIVADTMKVDVTVTFDPPATLWRLPIETVAQSERGFERAYQGTSLVASWPAAPGGGLEATLTVTIDDDAGATEPPGRPKGDDVTR